MLIPIGHENTDLRRAPVVTFTIMGICILIYILQSWYFNRDRLNREEQLLTEIYSYYNPRSDYLTLPPHVKRILEMYFTAPVYESDWEEFIEESPQRQKSLEEWEARRAADRQQEYDTDRELYDDYDYDGYDNSDSDSEDPPPVAVPEPEPIDEEAEQATLDSLVAAHAKQSVILWTWKWGYVPKDQNILGLFAYNFLHGGFFHLLFNLLFFYLFSPLLEDRYGRTFLASFFVLGGAFAGFMHGIMYPESPMPLVGSSGAVFAVLGGYLLKHWRNRIRFVLIIAFTGKVFSMPSWVAVPFWFLKELFMGYMSYSVDSSEAITGVAHWAHIWGFLFGLGVIALLRSTGLEKRYFPDMDVVEEESLSPLRKAQVSERLGQISDALMILRRGANESPDDEEILQHYWRLAKEHNRAQDMVIAGQKLINWDLGKNNVKMAHLRFREMMEVNSEIRLSVTLATRLIQALATERYLIECEEVLRHTVDKLENTSSHILMNLMEIATDIQSAQGLVIAQQLRQIEGFNEEETLKAMVARIQEGLGQGRPAMEQSLSDGDGGISLSLSAADGFEELGPPPKNVHALKVFPSTPRKVAREGLTLDVSGKERVIPYNQIKVLAVGTIREAGAKPILVIDLVFDRPQDVLPQHRVLRITSINFDPMTVLPKMPNAGEAWRRLLAILLKTSGATPAPSEAAALGKPYQSYPNLRAFEKDIYYGS